MPDYLIVSTPGYKIIVVEKCLRNMRFYQREVEMMFFGILREEMDVLGLEGLECNYEKLRGFVKMAKVRKTKV